ncbi:hypothetical protein [Pantoea ananatis]|nr:hypothetical protein [Pantoea ananatis]
MVVTTIYLSGCAGGGGGGGGIAEPTPVNLAVVLVVGMLGVSYQARYNR